MFDTSQKCPDCGHVLTDVDQLLFCEQCGARERMIPHIKTKTYSSEWVTSLKEAICPKCGTPMMHDARTCIWTCVECIEKYTDYYISILHYNATKKLLKPEKVIFT